MVNEVFRFKTIDDVDLRGKRVLLRVDVNSSIDVEKMEIRKDPRIRAVVPTLEALKESKVVLMAHQSRPGYPDFVSLELHARRLAEYLPGRVSFVEDIFGEKALAAIDALQDGQVLVLDNVRKWSPENKSYTLEEAAQTEMIRALAPKFDYFVNDAFGAAHRAQPSLIGWPTLLAGPLVGRELKACKLVMESPERPNVMIIGGAKALDKFQAMRHNLESGALDAVLVCGLTAIMMFEAQGIDMGEANNKLVREDLAACREDVVKVLEKFGDKVVLPVDMVTDSGGQREVLAIEDVGKRNVPTGDVGPATIEKFKETILGAKTIIANGPPGIFEQEVYRKGTYAVVDLMVQATERGAYTMIGGGEMGTAAEMSGKADKISFISTGGGALLEILSGHELPLVQALNAKAPK